MINPRYFSIAALLCIISCSEEKNLSASNINCESMKSDFVAIIESSLKAGDLNSIEASVSLKNKLEEINNILYSRFHSCAVARPEAAKEIGRVRFAAGSVNIMLETLIEQCGDNNENCVYSIIYKEVETLNSFTEN
ncbi:MAG: hypothetical protein ACN2B6_12745 [Rickettsiales bacterium]